MAHIRFSIAPSPVYESYKTALHEALDQHDYEILIPYKDKVNRCFEISLTISYEKKDYVFRMIILYGHGLFARKRRTINNRVAKTKIAFKEQNQRLI